MKKVNMKRFIYFFVFFLLLTLSLFSVMNALDSRTIQNSLVNTAKNQVSYAESVVNDMLYEAGMYAIQYTADSSVRFYQRQILELGSYDAQMKKNDIEERMKNTLLSSQSVESLGIYWREEGTFIATRGETLADDIYGSVDKRGWKYVNGSLYYFSLYPYVREPRTPEDIEYMVGVKLKTDYLRNLLQKSFNGGSSDAFFLVGDDLTISDGTLVDGIANKARETVSPDPKHILRFDYSSQGGDYFVLSKYIEPIDAYLVTYTRMSDFLEPLNRNRQVFFVSIVIILIIGLVVISTFYRNFYRNVYLLNKKFHQVEQGDYAIRILNRPNNEFGSLFGSFNHMVAQIQMLFTSLKTETDLRRNAEMKQLQAQINPHFLYNSLFFIMSMAKSSPEAVIRMSKHLAEYYRYLTRLDSSSVTLATELELAAHYLGIMALCKTMDYDIKLPDELKEQPIMPLIIQPIVENAILHGIEERQGAHRVAISVEAFRSGARITVANDGKPLSPEELRALQASVEAPLPPPGTDGIGLWNINQRLKNAYGDSCGLRFALNDWGGLSVTVLVDFSFEEGGAYAFIDRG
ncbi:histidine kinase [Paenibacillus lautus]|uniref:sensor histidine kinase n=1 Tax=Paenibacillus lautus TaxID=1401 RepID=UPI00203FB889|nr:histidine kinase [Paenibacillus lautus]MCM3257560.1 histidine kinase [Paenibacillus lautus]